MASRRTYGYSGSQLPIDDPSAVMNPYPCQCCGKPFKTRNGLANHLCDPYGRKEPKTTKGPLGHQFTEDEVRAIRKAYAEGTSQVRLGIEYGVTQTTIGRVVRRERYADVE
jgi:hypothetical protein